MIPTRRTLLLTGIAGAGTLLSAPAPALADPAESPQSAVVIESPAAGEVLTTPIVPLRVRVTGPAPSAVTVTVSDDATSFPDQTLPLRDLGGGAFGADWAIPADRLDGRTKLLEATAYVAGSAVRSSIRVTLGGAPTEPVGTVEDFEEYADDVALAAAYAQSGTSISLTPFHRSSGTVGLALDYDTSPARPARIRRGLADQDWSGDRALGLWLEGDGSGNRLTVDVQASGRWYRRTVALRRTAGRRVTLRLDRLRRIDEAGRRLPGRAIPADLAHVTALRLGVAGSGTGRIHLDQITRG